MKRNELMKKIILIFCAFIIAMQFCGCKQKASSKPRVALVMKSLANEFFKTMEEGAQAHHKEHSQDYDLITVGIKDEQDVAKQVEFVELMIAQGVNAIVIAPADDCPVAL